MWLYRDCPVMVGAHDVLLDGRRSHCTRADIYVPSLNLYLHLILRKCQVYFNIVDVQSMYSIC